ncbi:hypothetical protein AHP1_1621 [Aeromonas phage Ahp1_CNU-2021]|nr:hypothetical protein AHP1_1621 [Aeromonas phage Ahp1_CNU-2021]
MVIYIRGKAALMLNVDPETTCLGDLSTKHAKTLAEHIVLVRDNGTVEVIKSQSDYIRSVGNYFGIPEFLTDLEQYSGVQLTGFKTVYSVSAALNHLNTGW